MFLCVPSNDVLITVLVLRYSVCSFWDVGVCQSSLSFGVCSYEQKLLCEWIKHRFVLKLRLDCYSDDASIDIPSVSGRTNIGMSDIMNA